MASPVLCQLYRHTFVPYYYFDSAVSAVEVKEHTDTGASAFGVYAESDVVGHCIRLLLLLLLVMMMRCIL